MWKKNSNSKLGSFSGLYMCYAILVSLDSLLPQGCHMIIAQIIHVPIFPLWWHFTTPHNNLSSFLILVTIIQMQKLLLSDIK